MFNECNGFLFWFELLKVYEEKFYEFLCNFFEFLFFCIIFLCNGMDFFFKGILDVCMFRERGIFFIFGLKLEGELLKFWIVLYILILNKNKYKKMLVCVIKLV